MFALTVSGVLALAIGANTVMYSFVHVIALRPLPIRDEARVGFVEGLDSQRGDDRAPISSADFLDFRERVTTIDNLAAMSRTVWTLTGEKEPLRVGTARITVNMLDLWGLDAVVGRKLQSADDAVGAPDVVMLSHGFWQRNFASDSDVIGSSLALSGVPRTVVGIMTPDVEIGGLSEIDVWAPARIHASTAERARRDLRVSGRLVEGATIEEASAEISAIAQQLALEHPETNTGWGARLLSARDSMIGQNTWLILALLGVMVGGVLLVACANVTNLIMAKALVRQRELSLRTALGASGWRLVRQLLAESLLLSLVAGLLGLGLAEAGLRVIRAAAYEPFFELVVISREVLLFTSLLALVTPLIISVLPALQATRLDLSSNLKETAGRGASGGYGARRSRGTLVVSQLALACALLIVAGLAVRTIHALNNIDWGFEHRNLLTMRLELPEARYGTEERLESFYAELLPRLQASAAVDSAAIVHPLPIFQRERTMTIDVEGLAVEDPANQPWAVVVVATDDYLKTLRLPLLEGRALTPRDRRDEPLVGLISQEAAQRYWPEQSPIGRRFALREDGERSGGWIEIVGITGDFLSPDIDNPERPTLFLPIAQHPSREVALVLRTSSDPVALAPSLRAQVHELDSELAVYDVKTLEQTFEDEMASNNILSGMFSGFALIALVMAAAGLYAVISYSVTMRRQEIGIRMALGAAASQIRSMVLGQSAWLIGSSLVLGLALGFGLAMVMSSILFGVSPTDPMTYLAVAGLLSAVAVVGSYLPARRASRLDPISTLRSE
jgi:putative ABC transport system permease protein